MALLDILLVKNHLRIFDNDEDDLIVLYLEAAEASAIQYIDRPVYADGATLPVEGATGYDPTAITIPPAVTAAILLLAGELYETRESDPGTMGEARFPSTVRRLLAPWRVWRTFVEDEDVSALI